MKNHFNTTHLKGQALEQAEQQATSGQASVLDFFNSHPGAEFTACQVYTRLPELHNQPLTSTRRAITNLAKAGHLVKTNNRVPGIYGALAYTWRLSNYNGVKRGTQLALA